MTFITSARGIYLWVKYLNGITHYDDEDGFFNENPDIGRWSYKNVLKYMHRKFGRSSGDGNIFFEEVIKNNRIWNKILVDRKITTVDQLDYYARDYANWFR